MESNLLSRLEDLQPLVRAIAWRWSRDRPTEEDDLAQEIATRLWLVLRRRPDAPQEYLAAAARHAALDYRTRGPSVDRLSQSGRQHRWQMVSLEALLEEDDEETGHLPGPHRGDGASPVEDMVVARLLYDQLRERLTPRQAAFLILRLRGYSPGEAGDLLGLTPRQTNNVGIRLRAKARALWGAEGPVPGEAYAIVPEAAEELGAAPVTVCYYCRRGMLAGARLVRGRWLIPRPLRLKDGAVPQDPAVATVAEAAQELCLSPVTVAMLCRQGNIEGAYRQGRQWRIPRPIRLNRHDGRDGHATAQEAAQQLGLKPVTIAWLCRRGKLLGARLVGGRGGRWLIPRPIQRSGPTLAPG